MKKGKIMLMAIAVIAVVSGALAFKTNKFTAHTFYGCGRTIVGGETLDGCYSAFLSFVVPNPAGMIIPYDNIPEATICTPNTHTLVTCLATRVIPSLLEYYL